MAPTFCPRGFLRRLDAMVRANDGGPPDRPLSVAARPANSRCALALSPHPGGPPPSNRALQPWSGSPPPLQTPRFYPRPRRGGCELVHGPTRGADELLAWAARERKLAPALDGGPRR